MTSERIRRWLERHPEAIRDRGGTLSKSVALESVQLNEARQTPQITLEAIVRRERPVLFVRDGRLSLEKAFVDPQAKWLVEAAQKSGPVLDPIIPLIGRIEIRGALGPPFVGTGWLIDSDIVVTNRHVAVLLGGRENGRYKFYLDHRGQEPHVEINYRREIDDPPDEASLAYRITDILYIEADPGKADIAFLRVDRRTDGWQQPYLELADADPRPGDDIAVIGFPARTDASRAPDQDLMEKIFAGQYNVKRIAPGEVEANQALWATHDCTTLGGNSGSPVLSLNTGKVVALHFAGAYFLENYAVPCSVIHKYRKDKPWLSPYVLTGTKEREAPPFDQNQLTALQAPNAGSGNFTTSSVIDDKTGTVTFTVPLTITVSLASPAHPITTHTGSTNTVATIEAASDTLRRSVRSHQIRAVRPGFSFADDGSITDRPCIQVLVDPSAAEVVKAAAPAMVGNFPVAVRSVGVFDLAETPDEESVGTIAYDDDARTDPEFAFDPIDGEIDFRCHVGPERSWWELGEFIAGIRKEFVSSIYEFHAPYIADAIERTVIDNDRVTFSLVMDPQTRKGHEDTEREFDQAKRFSKWAERKLGQFERIYVPTGNGGLVRSSYHIKVSVRDADSVWLSSGNWTTTSQPKIPVSDEHEGNKTIRAGNREWHIVVRDSRLSRFFKAHIQQDIVRSRALGGRPEAVEAADIEVDVPETMFVTVELEAAQKIELIESQDVNEKARILPLLTPDHGGKVYRDAVLELIRSAQSELFFQIPYITAFKGGSAIAELVDALVGKSREIDACRIILRAENDPVACAQDLKRRGMDVDRCLRQIGRTHTKGMVVDGQRVLIGSHNWSELGVTLNRDASLLVGSNDVARFFRNAFLVDWNRARPVKAAPPGAEASSIRLATGAESPQGFKRMRLSDLLEG